MHHVPVVQPPELHRIKHPENHRGVREDKVENDGGDGPAALLDGSERMADDACFQKSHANKGEPRSNVGDGGRHIHPSAPFGDAQKIIARIKGKCRNDDGGSVGRPAVEGFKAD